MTSGGTASFGYGQLGSFPGYPSGGAAPAIGLYAIPSMTNIGGAFGSMTGNSVNGLLTGGAASIVGDDSMISGVGAMTGITTGAGGGGSVALPLAGFVSGVGGLMQAIGPYFGPYGAAASITGNMLTGFGGSVYNGYQRAQGQILNNADTILEGKVLNIETIVQELNTQSDVIRKMLKESVDSDSKALQNLS